ncbi:MAG: TonB-dependent receptor, partial [Ignavibacteria bacterium]|nr:TonB-dependent receptor [Ignavibacteria bacterium]
MKIKYLITIISLVTSFTLQSQTVRGTVYSDIEGNKTPLEDAVVKWINTTKGTLTDKNGNFEISSSGIDDKRLIVFHAGFKTDTVNVSGNYVEIILMANLVTEEIKIEERKKSTFFGNYEAKTEIISSKELVKEACCDLSGCFGRNSSVEVAVSDILSDSKELKILGLEGVYTQILVDNMPLLHGYNVKYGVSSIPGTSIDKITVSKGSNSVLWGYESISGIMNVLLKDYSNSDRLMFNGFLNSMFEKQGNLNITSKLSKKFSNIMMFHTTQKAREMDGDSDGFLDSPQITRYVLYDKLNFNDEETATEFNIAGRYWNEERHGGQFHSDNNRHYEQNLKINSGEGYFRLSKNVNETDGFKIYAATSYYKQKSIYGITSYDAVQTIINLMGFYEWGITDKIFLKTGTGYKLRKCSEEISFSDITSRSYAGNYKSRESVPGIFTENSVNLMDDKLSVMTGLRLDFHNTGGTVFTPRILVRYQPDATLVFRVSAGTGFRIADIFNENMNLFGSSRDVVITEILKPEKMINFGLNGIYYFSSTYFSGNLNFDLYRTEFSNKVIADYDSDPKKIYFSNLHGRAYSNVFQAEVNLTLLRNIDMKLAYKLIDVKYEKNNQIYDQPLNSRHRVLGTVSYSPDNDSWAVNLGLNWYGRQRIPSTLPNPVQYRRA